jgi:hypothetical protein
MDNGLAEGYVGITQETADIAKKALSTAIDKKVWLKENKPENIKDMDKFQDMLDDQLGAFEELRTALIEQS